MPKCGEKFKKKRKEKKSRVVSNNGRGVVYFLAGFHFLKSRNSNNVRLFLAKVLHHKHSVSERDVRKRYQLTCTLFSLQHKHNLCTVRGDALF